jgi:hypothetical protein
VLGNFVPTQTNFLGWVRSISTFLKSHEIELGVF